MLTSLKQKIQIREKSRMQREILSPKMAAISLPASSGIGVSFCEKWNR